MAKRNTDEATLLKLKEIKQPFTALLHDYAGPFESEYGESYLLSLRNPKTQSEAKLFVGEKTGAFRSLVKAMTAGRLTAVDQGGTIEATFSPKELKPNEKGEVFTAINLRFGKAVTPGDTEDGEEIAPPPF